MINAGSQITVHILDCNGREISTRNFGKVFEVREENGKLGIDWNTEHSPYTCKGNEFCPLDTFASTVYFEDVKTKKRYHFSNMINRVVEGVA